MSYNRSYLNAICIVLSLLFVLLGIFLIWFGVNLSSNNVFFDSFSNHLIDLKPTPAMLEKLDYKLYSLADLSFKAGIFISIPFFLIFYAILKGFNLYNWLYDSLMKIYLYLGGRENLRKLALILGSSIIFLIGYILLLFSVGLHFFKITVTVFHFPLSFFVTILTLAFLSKRLFSGQWVKMFAISSTILIVLILISYFLANLFFDTAFDSLAYHQEIMLRLKDGWNLYSLNNPLHTKEFIASHVYTQAKAPEIYQAAFVKFTNQIESGKMFNFLLIFGSFLIVFYVLTSFNWISTKIAIISSILFAANPVSIYQSASYYLDGQLSSMLVCMFAIATMLIFEKSFLYVVILFLAIIIVSNIKLTGLVYSFMITSVLTLILFFKEHFKFFVFSSMSFLFAAVLAMFLVGFNPYVTNHIYHGHIFYPFFGKNSVSVTHHGPPTIQDKNQVEKGLISLFSASENYYVGRLTEYNFKFPFWFNAHELTCFANTDTRLGGFGPLFGGMLIVSIGIIFALFFVDKNTALFSLFFFLWVFVSAFIITEPWWARFVPQIYIAGVFPIVTAYSRKEKIFVILRNFLLFLAIINTLLISSVYYVSQYITSESLRRQLTEISKTYSKIYVYFPFGAFSSMYRLKEANINAELVKEDYFKEQPQKLAADFFMGYYVGEKKEKK